MQSSREATGQTVTVGAKPNWFSFVASTVSLNSAWDRNYGPSADSIDSQNGISAR
jgi:hypothetical protein